MIKRVGLSHFSPSEVSRKVQQCLRLEGVNNTNGVFQSENDICTEVKKETNYTTNDDVISEKCSSDKRIKSNFLTTIKKKLKKSKRNKCSEMHPIADSNMCRCSSENCELSSFCASHFRLQKIKYADKNIWPVSSPILRCQNHQITKDDDAAELIPNLVDESELCSCFGLQSKYPDYSHVGTDDIPSGSKLPTRTCSLSDVSFNDEVKNSGLSPKVESETDLTKLCMLNSNSIENSNSYRHNIASPNIITHSPNENLVAVPKVGNLTTELHKLSKYGWYWGPITRTEAESKLIDQPDGAFLVRDSSDDRYILSLSFRSYRKTFHTRIEHSNGLFSFYSQPEPGGQSSIVELIQQSMCVSQSGVFCYSRGRTPGAPSIPVRLTKPVSRFTQVRSLQYLCRFIIRQYTRYDHIQKLPLPPIIKGYLEEGHY